MTPVGSEHPRVTAGDLEWHLAWVARNHEELDPNDCVYCRALVESHPQDWRALLEAAQSDLRSAD